MAMAVVFYDLETTGLSLQHCEVLQIAAWCENRTFNCYIMPRNGINPWATAVNKLSVSSDGQLCKDGQALDTVEEMAAWHLFIDFLKVCPRNAVLVAYNGFRFDHRILMRCVKQLGLRDLLLDVAPLAADTMTLFPIRGKLSAIAANNGVDSSQAHSAMGDVDMMRKLCDKFGIDNEIICNSAQQLQNFG